MLLNSTACRAGFPLTTAHFGTTPTPAPPHKGEGIARPSDAKWSITSITSITHCEKISKNSLLEISERDRPQITTDHIDHTSRKSVIKTGARKAVLVIAAVDSGKNRQFFTRKPQIPGQNGPILVPIGPLRTRLRSPILHGASHQ